MFLGMTICSLLIFKPPDKHLERQTLTSHVMCMLRVTLQMAERSTIRTIPYSHSMPAAKGFLYKNMHV